MSPPQFTAATMGHPSELIRWEVRMRTPFPFRVLIGLLRSRACLMAAQRAIAPATIPPPISTSGATMIPPCLVGSAYCKVNGAASPAPLCRYAAPGYWFVDAASRTIQAVHSLAGVEIVAQVDRLDPGVGGSDPRQPAARNPAWRLYPGDARTLAAAATPSG